MMRWLLPVDAMIKPETVLPLEVQFNVVQIRGLDVSLFFSLFSRLAAESIS